MQLCDNILKCSVRTQEDNIQYEMNEKKNYVFKKRRKRNGLSSSPKVTVLLKRKLSIVSANVAVQADECTSVLQNLSNLQQSTMEPNQASKSYKFWCTYRRNTCSENMKFIYYIGIYDIYTHVAIHTLPCLALPKKNIVRM